MRAPLVDATPAQIEQLRSDLVAGGRDVADAARDALDEPPAPRPRRPASAFPAAALRIVALGGLGEIGRNMTVFEHAGRLLIVDCGVLFPETDQPGVDLILPDFTYVRDRLDDIEAIVLTHAHEDHIGAVPYLLRERGTSRWSAPS